MDDRHEAAGARRRALGCAGVARSAVALAFVVVGCGKSEPPSPRAALEGALVAAKEGNADAFRGAFMSAEEVASLFECPAGVDLAARYATLSDELVAWRDARPSIARFAVRDTTALDAGGEVEVCKARRAFALVAADVELARTTPAPGPLMRTVMRFVVFDERARILAW